MKITQLLTTIGDVHWLSVGDTVREALDHMDAYDLTAAPLLDWDGRYLGTVTEADLRRHVDRATSVAAPLAAVERRSHNVAVSLDREVTSLIGHASTHPFVPVVDDCGKLVGIVDRHRILDTLLPRAA